jgi:hypothetical protein
MQGDKSYQKRTRRESKDKKKRKKRKDEKDNINQSEKIVFQNQLQKEINVRTINLIKTEVTLQ